MAQEAIKRIAKLYEVEKRARFKSPQDRVALRQEYAKPIFDDLEVWLRAQLNKMSGKTPLAKAIKYALTRLPKARPYLDHGFLELDNNTAERAMRSVAKRVSLCTPSSSVCKHWKCIRVNDATRATFSGYGSFDRFRRQVVGTDMIWSTGHNLHSR